MISRIAHILGWIWNIPVTLVGLLLCAVGGVKFVRMDPDWTFHGHAQPSGMFYRWFDTYKFAAITIGQMIVYKLPKYDVEVFWIHEKTHTRQGLVFGPLFWIAYYGESMWQYARGRHAYWDNRFEVQARRSETVGRPLNLWE